jgi:hypothetical protein
MSAGRRCLRLMVVLRFANSRPGTLAGCVNVFLAVSLKDIRIAFRTLIEVGSERRARPFWLLSEDLVARTH